MLPWIGLRTATSAVPSCRVIHRRFVCVPHCAFSLFVTWPGQLFVENYKYSPMLNKHSPGNVSSNKNGKNSEINVKSRAEFPIGVISNELLCVVEKSRGYVDICYARVPLVYMYVRLFCNVAGGKFVGKTVNTEQPVYSGIFRRGKLKACSPSLRMENCELFCTSHEGLLLNIWVD